MDKWTSPIEPLGEMPIQIRGPVGTSALGLNSKVVR